MAILKDILAQKKILRIMGCHDPLGAQIAQEHKYNAVWFSGFELATSSCCPDASILTMTDNLNAISRIIPTINIPLIADCDSGFGDINNVIHMVKAYERNGVAAVCIEDKKFPKLNSFANAHQELEDVNLFCAKIKAAIQARCSDYFLVIARLESYIAGEDTHNAVRRAQKYIRAGADALLIHSKKETEEDIVSFCREFQDNIPIFIVPTTYAHIKIQEVCQLSQNIKGIIYANHCIRASIAAMRNVCREIYEAGTSSVVEGKIASVKEALEYQGMQNHLENYKRYINND